LIKIGAGYVFAGVNLHQLPDLLGKGHAAQQFAGAIGCGCGGCRGIWGSCVFVHVVFDR